MTTTAGQSILNTALFEALFVSDIRQLGAAVASAKQTLLANGDAYFEQISQTFLLLGDPALTLKIPLPRMPTGVEAYRQNSAVHIRWNAALDANGNAVAGYNVYRASSPAGPYRKINAELVTETEYVDSAGSVGADGAEAGASSSYYAVSSVDSDGDESAQSLGISPAALSFAPSSDGGGSSSGTGGGGGAAGCGGCFIDTVRQSMAKPWIWLLLLMIIAGAITCRRQEEKHNA